MLTLWGHENAPNVRKVIWTCEELGLDFERKDIGGPFGGTETPAYRAINPNGRIPTLDDDGFVLWESHAIMRYLIERSESQTLVPSDPHARALVNQWMDWQAAHLAPTIRALVVLVLKPGDTLPTQAQIDSARENVLELLGILEAELAERRHIVGNEFTLADIPIAINYNMWKVISPDYRSLPALDRWYGHITARKAFRPLRGGPSGGKG